MKDLRKDKRGEWCWKDIVVTLLIAFVFIVLAIVGLLMVAIETDSLTIRITNTSEEPLYVEIYANGAFYLNDTIDSKGFETYEYKNGFWGPGNTQIVVKLPNTLFEKEGWGGHTVSFVFE